jgi:hypothetical protein
MKLLLLLPLLLLFGCIGAPLQPAPNITKVDNEWSKYTGFASFEFPSSMALVHKLSEYQEGKKVASVVGSDPSKGRTILALIYTNITQYGPDSTYKADPAKTVKSFLASDRVSDPSGLMTNARDISDISEYNESGKVFFSELNFSISILGQNNDSKMSGYALNIYYPDKAALYRFRVVSEDGSFSKKVKDRFMKSFKE